MTAWLLLAFLVIAAEPLTPSNIFASGVSAAARAAMLFFTTSTLIFLVRNSFRNV